MNRVLPTPDDILEELGDKVIAQIDKLAVTGFDAALEEMSRYHRFLIDASETISRDGERWSYSEVSNFFGAPFEHWMRQYRRIAERSVERMGDESHFVMALARMPLRLLPANATASSPRVLASSLDFMLILVHRLEVWFTRRRIRNSEVTGNRQILAGSDRRTYEDVLIDTIGAWETVLSLVPSIYAWSDSRRAGEDREWEALKASWQLLRQHLRNTAYLFVAAIWNDDEIGAQIYRDALVRWRSALAHELEVDGEFRFQYLLTPSLFNQTWKDAKGTLAHFVPDYLAGVVKPVAAFAIILSGAHSDAIILSAAVALRWYMSGKGVAEFAPQEVLRLLKHVPFYEDDVLRHHYSPIEELSFRSLFLQFLRLDIAGERFKEGSYGSWLDGFVSTLDQMSERPVVPGRTYTPTTIHGRDNLLHAMLAIILAFATDEAPKIGERVEGLARNEALLPNRDRTLRGLAFRLDEVAKVLATPAAELTETATALSPNLDASAAMEHFRAANTAALASIAKVRAEQLRARPTALAKFEEIRQAINNDLMATPVPFFSGFRIVRVRAGTAKRSEFRLNQFPKGVLVEPPMDDLSSLPEHVAKRAANFAGIQVWNEFVSRPREFADVKVPPLDRAFWEASKALSKKLKEPALLLSLKTEDVNLRRWAWDQSKVPTGIQCMREPNQPQQYLFTIEGVRVFLANGGDGGGIMFSLGSLRSVLYETVEPPDSIVQVSFEPNETDAFHGLLRIAFAQRTEWDASPIIELR